MPMWPRLVLLDYDMTLMHTLIDFFEAVNAALEKYGGRTLSFNEFLYLFENERLGEIVPSGVEPRVFWRYFRRVYRTRYGYPSPGAEYMLRILSMNNTHIVIVTGRENCRIALWDELRRFGLHEYIDEVYSMRDLELLGGDEEELFDKSWLIQYVLRNHGAEPREAVLIGDYMQDYYSAARAGIFFIGYAIHEKRRRQLRAAGAKYIVSSLYEIPYTLYVIKKTLMKT